MHLRRVERPAPASVLRLLISHCYAKIPSLRDYMHLEARLPERLTISNGLKLVLENT
jgi:hypothetical protein